MEQPITQFCIDCQKDTTHYWKTPPVGKKWRPFYGCINYKQHGTVQRTGWQEERATAPLNASSDGLVLVLEEVQALRKEFNERMDALGKFLAKPNLKDL